MTAVYGLLGYPLSHSFSKGYFTEKFLRENTPAVYSNFELPLITDFPAMLAATPRLSGLNVTIPYKQAVMSYLDELDPEAAAIGAVNVVRFERRNEQVRLIGHNTDVIGFRESIRPLIEELQLRIEDRAGAQKPMKALVLGTGGASKAIVFGLNQLGIETQLVSRQSALEAVSYEELTDQHYSEYSILVNTTPLGMHPRIDTFPPLNYSMINRKHLLFDAVYNPEKTLFLQKGEQQGAIVKNGLEMLHLQAEAAWKIWNEITL